MKTAVAMVLTLALSAHACQSSLDLDDYAFGAPMTGDEPLQGQGGASPSEPNNGGAPNTGAGGDETAGSGDMQGFGGELPEGMGGAPLAPDNGGAGNGAAGSDEVAGGGMMGVAGTGGGGGQGGAPTPPAVAACTGCVELVVPVEGGGRTPFQFQLPEPADFSDGSVTWRIYSLDPNPAFFIKAAVQNGLANNFSGLFHQPGIPLDRAEWTDIVLDVAASDAATAPPGTELYTADGAGIYDKTQIVLIGVEVGALDSFVGTGEVRVLVDQVIINNVPGVTSKTFAADAEGLFADVFEGLPRSELIYHAESGG